MEIKVRVYYDNVYIAPEEMNTITIKNVSVDRIVNDIADKTGKEEKQNSEQERKS